MKTMRFKSYNEYTSWTDLFEDCSEYEMYPVAIDDGKTFAIDFTTECKTWKTALNRFFKIFGEMHDISWLEAEMRECCGNGTFSFTWLTPEEVKAGDGSQYFWGVEENQDGLFYVYATLKGCQYPN